MSDCFHPNPLVHGGSSQEQRMLPALSPDTAPIDGRGIDELILFLEKYAGLLNYYDETNAVNGEWRSFMAHDLSTLLASISATPYDDCLAVYYKYFNKIQDEFVIADLKKYTKILFDISFTLADKIRKWNEKLALKTPAKDMLYQEISNRIAYDFRDLLQYYASAKPAFVNAAFLLQPGAEDYIPLNTEDILLNEFRQEWWVKFSPADIITGWTNYKNVYLPAHPLTKNVFSASTLTGTDNIQYSSSYLRTAFTSIYNSYTRIITSVKQYFLDSITTYPFHRAHNGLIIAFLKLFGTTQKELNRLTDRHLNFYYKDVLRINRKPPVADSVHMVFTLAKNTPPYTLEKATELLAGKDNTGKELVYQTTDTITVNNSEVGALKSVFIDDNLVSGVIYAAEISNSSDGKGKELSPDDPSWFAFGASQPINEDARSMSLADAGFLIASPILQLSEGKRIITIDINISNFNGQSFTAGELAGNLDIAFTGKKDWILQQLISSSDTNQTDAIKVDVPGNKIILKITLAEDADALVPFDAAVHKAAYTTQWPVLRCLFRKTSNVSLYKKLSAVTISNIHIGVEVQNAFSCILHNDQGGLDAKNPFMPFGARPKKGSSFYFGSYETFSKKLTEFKLNLSWMGLPETGSLYSHYTYQHGVDSGNNALLYNYLNHYSDDYPFTISASVNETALPGNHLFGFTFKQAVTPAQQLGFASLFAASQSDLEYFTEYSPSLRRGFLKVTLTGPSVVFGHDVFNNRYTHQLIEFNKYGSNYSIPNEPYTPLLKPLTYSYKADETITVGAGADVKKGQFFHVFPFGFAEKNSGSGINVFNPFIHVNKAGTKNPLQGAMFIGIKNINPSQILNLYLEFSEGSEDASLDPPGIGWSYMSSNDWKLLDDHILADSTNGFLGSGIVKITMPDDMNDDNTAMPLQLRWIRVGITGLFTAYPKLYAVFTNAVKATFDDRENETSHLASPLKAGIISKLLNSTAAIKKVAQPYDSFDGKTQEQDKAYYTRVSERLRHKNRSITIWDYERLTLEQFSFLYKAKCLNHTNDVTETAPGCVRLIAVPDMSRKSTGNLFEPKISNNKRKKIKDYLSSLNCPFADLQVQNPQYEAIRVKCEVRIRQGLDETAHIEQLKTDIDKFLAPWAFDESRGIDFGGTVHRSQIIYFIEKLHYVDFVTDFLMDVYINGSINKTNTDEAKATTSKSILTTYRNHLIGKNVCAS